MKPGPKDDPLKYAAKRPEFFETPGVDRLYALCMALTEQLAISNERYDTLIRVLAERGALNLEDLANYEPGPEVEQARNEEHMTLLQRVLQVIDDEIDARENTSGKE